MSGVKPCPWCGWQSVKMQEAHTARLRRLPFLREPLCIERSSYRCRCAHCGFLGKEARTRWGAKRKWNRAPHDKRRYHIYGREF